MAFENTRWANIFFGRHIPEILEQLKRLNDNIERYLDRGQTDIWIVLSDSAIVYAVCPSEQDAQTRKAAIEAARGGRCHVSGPHTIAKGKKPWE